MPVPDPAAAGARPWLLRGRRLGVVPGILGLLQTNEALKVLLGIGNTLAGRLVLFDALETEFTELQLRRDPNCPVCSDEAVAARRDGRPLTTTTLGADAPFLMTTTALPRTVSPEARACEHRVHPTRAARECRRREVARHRRRFHPDRRHRAGPATPVAGRAALLTEDGDINRFVNVYVNGQDVRYLAGLDTPVTPGDEVRLLPAMAGG